MSGNDEHYTSEDPEDERATPRLDDTLSQVPPWHTGPEWSGWHSGTARTGHRAAATNFLNQEDWVGQHAAIAAIAHAVLALSAPVPEEGSWRQRAIEAEAALTAIGGITESPDGIVSRMEKIRRVLSASGQQRILTADERDRLIRMATLIAGTSDPEA